MRKRFRKSEDFMVGDNVEWRNATVWKRGRIVSGLQKDSDGYEYRSVKNLSASTTTVLFGQVERVYPGSIRKA